MDFADGLMGITHTMNVLIGFEKDEKLPSEIQIDRADPWGCEETVIKFSKEESGGIVFVEKPLWLYGKITIVTDETIRKFLRPVVMVLHKSELLSTFFEE